MAPRAVGLLALVVGHAAGTRSFRHFSDQLYCSGSEERLCTLEHNGKRTTTQPGECLWFTPDKHPVTEADMDPGNGAARGKWGRQSWDPVAAGVVGAAAFPLVDRGAAQACLRGKLVHFAGDSTTRDTYLTLASLLGLGETAKFGRMTRWRDTLAGAGGTKLTFQFLAFGNYTKEVDMAKSGLSAKKADLVFVQCFMYDRYRDLLGPQPESMGEACMQYLSETVGYGSASSPPVYLLGTTHPPGWVDPYENRTQAGSVMSRIFASVNAAAGITCRRSARTGDYIAVSSRGIRGPIDRYNIVGHRKGDRIHPLPNAQQAVVRMMMRHVCPPKGLVEAAEEEEA